MEDRIRSMSMSIVRRDAVDATRRSVVIAANDRARTVPEIDLAGLRFDNYRRNPVVMWAHDSTGRSPSGGLPIGRTLNISRVEDGGIVAEFEFLDDDPFAQRIRNAWDKGFLQAASISWLPTESVPTKHGGVRDVRAELLEWSIVSVPADPDALRETHRRMLDSLIEGEASIDIEDSQDGKNRRRSGMTTTDIQGIRKDLADINSFVRERFEPVSGEIGLLREETERIARTVNSAVERERSVRRNALSGYAQDAALPTVPTGAYAGMDILDLALVRRFAHSQRREGFGPAWIERAEEAKRLLAASITPADIQASHTAAERRLERWFSVDSKDTGQFQGFSRQLLGAMTRAAMDSTTAGSGDELVATLEARELWQDVNLQTLVAPLVPTFPMPSNPFEVPRQLGDVNFFPGTENTASTDTALTTGRTTLTAFELVGQVPYSFTLEEDGVIAMLPEIRAGLVRNVAEVLDDIILNADRTKTNGINTDGATISASTSGKAHWLLGYDGIIHLPLVDNTSQANNHNAAVSDDMFNELRTKLGKYGARPSQLAWVMDVNTFIRAQSVSQYRTMDKLGPNATLLTGMLGAVEGIPVIVSEQMALADVDGKITDGAATNTKGRLLLVNRTQWAQGFRRQLMLDVDRDTQKRQTVVTVSFRHALAERSGTRSTATHTGLQYNINLAA
ncbi:MAG: phage major capsid protein [Chloroflexi bacterium]|nr:phage major capsid protein [Chloroflexota bacterium]